MAVTRWGIIGPGAIAHNFADGLAECAAGELVAVAGRGAERREAFAARYGVGRVYDSHADLIADPEVDAVYIATAHTTHAQIAIDALRGGKPVLCEKPAGLNAAEVTAVTEVAAQEGLFFAEGYMYRCHPQIARVLDIIAGGEIGEVVHLRASFGFFAERDPASRLYDRALAGGGILDVGGYPVSLAILLAGAAPVQVAGSGVVGPTGVDEAAYGVLRFASGIAAEVACAVHREMENTAVIEGTKGRITLPEPWAPGRDAGPSSVVIHVQVGDTLRSEEHHYPEHLFTFEAQMASAAIAEGLTEAPAPAVDHAQSVAINQTLDRWRAAVGYTTIAADVGAGRMLSGVIPVGAPSVPKVQLPGVVPELSQLLMGCDNLFEYDHAAVMWDAWVEAGGSTFDTAHIYCDGLSEVLLGQWVADRGVQDQVQIVTKGGHSPYCTPRALGIELAISLERLGMDHVPLFIMHRDNEAVPVGEFAQALHALREAGHIGAYGGSNWSAARYAEFNAYAAAHGMAPMSLLNNNLSLAVMERAIWGGCISSNNAEALAALREGDLAHLSWSSQARGYFLPAALRDRLPADIGPEVCFGSRDNAERRRRAEQFAATHGVTANNIALAWVLQQSFPSLAVIGPRSVGEITSTLPALGVVLTDQERDWLNLEDS